MVTRAGVCGTRGPERITGSSSGVEETSCKTEGISPILVGIITALVTALVTGLVVMAMMRLACSQDSRVDEAGKREA